MSLTVGWALVLTFIWMMLTSQVNIQGFAVGFFISLLIQLLFRPGAGRLDIRRLPGQILALLVYLGLLYRDIFLSSLDIARRILSPKMKLNPGVLAVPVQDPGKAALITALSAHAMSLTPGELVIEIEGDSTLYVHALDIDAAVAHAYEAQTKRLRLLNRIIGKDER